MANRRVIVKRRKSVRNIRKITRTMQLIATARFQAALNRALAAKPYTQKLAELVEELTANAGEGVSHPLMKSHDNVGRTAMVAISTARGLCGGYNGNVLRTAVSKLDELAAAGKSTDVHMVGKKGINYFRFLGRELHDRITTISDAPKFEQIEPLANQLIDQYSRGEVSAVYVSYMRFHSIARQKAEVLQLLPLSGPAKAEGTGTAAKSGSVQFEFSPAPRELLDELLPATVRVRLFQCFIDAAVSEQIARMVAMKAATDAAGDMITSLTRQYNRARQTHITMELLDIIGGVNALA